MATKKESKTKAPWEKPAPKSAKHKPLSDTQKKEAQTRAKKAGRPYPNLVDNMAAKKNAAPKKTAKKAAPKKDAAKKASVKKADTRNTPEKKAKANHKSATKESAKSRS